MKIVIVSLLFALCLAQLQSEQGQQGQQQSQQGQQGQQQFQQGQQGQQQSFMFRPEELCSKFLQRVLSRSGDEIQSVIDDGLDQQVRVFYNGRDVTQFRSVIRNLLSNVGYMSTIVESHIFNEQNKICALKLATSFLPNDNRCLATTSAFVELLFNDQDKVSLVDIVSKVDPQVLQCLPDLSQFDQTQNQHPLRQNMNMNTQ